jgi:predicted polyphosphate/ATP-dependent NAD kinase
MKREDDQELWDLLGRAAEPELLPIFTRNIVRQVRQDGGRSERMRKWISLRRLIPASAVAIALMTAIIATHHPVSQKSSQSEPDVVAKIDPQDYEVVADLDELLAVDKGSLWDEKPTL